MQNQYYISRMQARDFRGLKEADAALSPGLILFTGKNGNGKTSLGLLAQFMIEGPEPFKGGRRMNAAEVAQLIIRDGADMAVCKATLVTPRGEWTVRRSIERGGEVSLRIEAEGLDKVSTTQATLSNLLAGGTLDPLAFLKMDPRKQVDEVLDIAGLRSEAAQITAERKRIFDERAEQNGIVKRLDATYKQMDRDAANEPPNTPAVEVNTDALIRELQDVHDHNKIGDQLRAEADTKARGLANHDDWTAQKEGDVDRAAAEVARLEDALAHAKSTLAFAEEAVASHAKTRVAVAQFAEDARAKADSFQPKPTEDLEKRIAEAGQVNEWVRKKQARLKHRKEFTDAFAVAEDLSAQIKACDEKKRTLLANANLPVAGLSFEIDEDGEGDLVYNGRRISLLSQAEGLCVAIPLAFARPGAKLKIAWVTGEHGLDDDNLALAARLTEEAGASLLLESIHPAQGVQTLTLVGGRVEKEAVA